MRTAITPATIRSLGHDQLLAWIASADQLELRRIHDLALPPECDCVLVPQRCGACDRLRETILAVLRDAGPEEWHRSEVLAHTVVSDETVERALNRLVDAKVLRRRTAGFRTIGTLAQAKAVLARSWRCDCPVMPSCRCKPKPPAVELPEPAWDLLRSRLDWYREPPPPALPVTAYSRPAMAEEMALRAAHGRGLRHHADVVQVMRKSRLVLRVNRRRNGSVKIEDIRRG